MKDFSCRTIQLPTNFRCPQSIVDAANRLVVYNTNRLVRKVSAKAAKTESSHVEHDRVRFVEFETDRDEAAGIADGINQLNRDTLTRSAVIARNATLLESMRTALGERRVPAVISRRRDDFVSPQMRWLVACLKQVNRPMDKRNIVLLAEAFESFSGFRVDLEELFARSEAQGTTYLSVWVDGIRKSGVSGRELQAVDLMEELAVGAVRHVRAINQVLSQF